MIRYEQDKFDEIPSKTKMLADEKRRLLKIPDDDFLSNKYVLKNLI